MSKEGKAKGVFIQHRECGTLVELGPEAPEDGFDVEGGAVEANGHGDGSANGNGHANGSRANGSAAAGKSTRRAVGKMKATITQRFVDPADSVEYDVDCDCRFIFFVEKVNNNWRTVFVKLFYEKDKIVPADGHAAPKLTTEERKYMKESLPQGYRYLGVMQRRLGYAIDEKLPTPRNEGWEAMYTAMESWLVGGKAVL